MPEGTDFYSSFTSNLDRALQNGDKLSDDTIKNIQLTGDYLNQKSDYDNNIYDPDGYYKSLEDSISKRRESLSRGVAYVNDPALDWLPNWVKAGYNSSLQGLTQEIATGKRQYNLTGYHPSLLADVGSTLVSFLMPADFLTMAVGGGIGGFGAKAAVQSGLRKAIQTGASSVLKGAPLKKSVTKAILGKNYDKAWNIMRRQGGIKKSQAQELINIGTENVLQKAIMQGSGGATGLGFYSGLQSSLGQIADPNSELDMVMALKEGGKGAILGAVTAGTQPITREIIKRNLSRPITTRSGEIAQEAAVKAVETTQFGTLAPALSGEAPSLESYAHAAGVIGGLGAQRYAMGKMVRGYRNIRDARQEAIINSSQDAEALARISEGMKDSNVYIDKDGVRVKDITFEKKIVKQKGKKDRTETFVNMVDASTQDPLKPITMREFQRRVFSTKSAKHTPESLETSRRKNIFQLKDRLKLSLDEFRNKVDTTRGKGESYKYKEKETGYGSLNSVQKLKLLENLRHERRVGIIKNRLESAGYMNSLLPKKYLGDIILPDIIPKGWRRLEKRGVTQYSTRSYRKINEADSRMYTLLGEALQKFIDIGLFKEGIPARLSKVTKAGREASDKMFRELADKLEDPAFSNDPQVKKYREVMDWMWETSKKAGIDLGKKEDFYFPRVIKQEFLEIFNSEIAKVTDKNPQLFNESSNFDKPEFQKKLGLLVRSGQIDKRMRDVLYEMAGIPLEADAKQASQIRDYDARVSKAFKVLNNRTTTQFHNVAKHLEVSRIKDELPNSILERDPRLVLTRYANQWARRVSFVENFGKRGEYITETLKQLKDIEGKANKKDALKLGEEQRILSMAFDAYTNKIEMNPSYNWKAPWARKVWSDITNFEIATKIGLGFATIPNLTQLTISTALKAGYMPLFKAIYKISRPTEEGRKYRSAIKKSGTTNLSIFQTLFGLEPSAENSFMGRWAERFTTASGFKKINQINQLVSAATAKEWIGDLQKVATGKGKGLSRLKSRRWAVENLKELGINDVNKITDRQTAEAMYRFARDTQLQKNILQEALAFNDPRFRPFFLFKKFGYKQFNWIKDQLISEVRRGNIFPMLRLSMAGMLGGEFVAWARDAMGEFWAGKEVYDENEYFLNLGNVKDVALGAKEPESLIDVSKMTWADVVDRFASVGAFGILGDMVAAENKFRALEFAAKPAVAQDFDKIWLTMTKTWENIGDYGGVGALKRMPKYLAPALGTVPRRVAERYKPAGQQKADTKRRKGIVKTKIFEYMIDGNDVMSARLIENWNRSYPENPIMYDDIDADAIYNFLKKKAERRANP